MTNPKQNVIAPTEFAFVFDSNAEYEFYPEPLSREASFEKLMQDCRPAIVDPSPEQTKPIYNPKIRNQISKMRKHKPWFLGTVSLIQVFLMGYSHYLNWQTTGQAIMDVSKNFLIGPSAGTLIRMGARFNPCMKPGTGLDTVPKFQCFEGIKGTQEGGLCNLADVCDFFGLTDGSPNQWFRFVTAIFLHGGWLHLIMNMSFQIQSGFSLEKDMGPWRMGLIYIISGVGGFVFGATLSDVTSSSVGASGSLYGMIGCLLLDLIQNWSLIKKPWKELFKMIALITFSFMFGMLPNVDNLAHVGGFIFGILSGLLLMPKIYFGKWDRRRKLLFTILAAPMMISFMVLFIVSFYTGENYCTFCKYFNCIPGLPWCEDKFNVRTTVTFTYRNVTQ